MTNSSKRRLLSDQLHHSRCDTTFTENCDPSRDYAGIAALLTAQVAASTLRFMQTHVTAYLSSFREPESSSCHPTPLPYETSSPAQSLATESLPSWAQVRNAHKCEFLYAMSHSYFNLADISRPPPP
ncbi:hypothetical protein C8R47DRAFT_1080171 [Mycena vitilis]|nr:hypothetical protein C8R47DRAFT_1080171 [Mycena vitilis]